MTTSPFDDLLSLHAETRSRDTLGSLEWMLTAPEAFGLTTATPSQRAICRVADGLPLGELERDVDVQQIFGGADAMRAASRLGVMPKEVVLLAGIRGAKSMLAGAAALRSAWAADLSGLAPGEVPRVAILSVKLDTAKATWSHIAGQLMAKPALASLLVEEPKADSVMVRNRSGRPVEIRIVAGGRAATSLVARWLVAFIGDEAPRMVGAEDGVANLDDARIAVAGRMRPGAQTFLIGSPWAPFGPVYKLDQEHFGKPSRAIVVIKAKGPQMNPVWWTPERCEDVRLRNPDAYRVDVDCGYLSPEESLFSDDDIRAAQRAEPGDIPPDPGLEYAAAIDPATRSNAWTLVVTTCTGRVGALKKRSVVLVREWVGARTAAERLKSPDVLREIATLLRPYRVDTVITDQWAADPLRDIAEQVGLYLQERAATAADNVDMYSSLKMLMENGALDLPPDAALRADLLGVRRRVTQAGVSIDLSSTSNGRHCDYAPSLARACAVDLREPAAAPDPAEPPRDEWHERQRARWQRDNDPDNNDWILGPGRR